MARLPRIDLPGYAQHVYTRGNDHRACFMDDAERWLYLRLLGHAAREAGCSIHAYVLMTNHVHLVVTGHGPGAIAGLMQYTGSRYVTLFNRRHRRSGTLFEGRYHASVIDTEAYFFTCTRYVEANPLRAGMVTRPEEYKWSSFGANASGAPGGLLSPHPLYFGLGSDPASRAAAYRTLSGEEMPAAQLEAIRVATFKNRVLGRPSFCAELESRCDRLMAPKPVGRPKKGTGRNVL